MKLPNLNHHYHCNRKSSEDHMVICKRDNYYHLNLGEMTAAAILPRNLSYAGKV